MTAFSKFTNLINIGTYFHIARFKVFQILSRRYRNQRQRFVYLSK